jgi:hypothetical protein
MIEFVKPANLDGNVLETELAKVGITIPPRSITVVGDLLYLDITEAQKSTAQSILDLLGSS